MLKTRINPRNLQEVLDSASNAAAKGQAQYFTPPEWGEVLSRPLPRYRPVVVDLTCGNGQLLAAAAGKSTNHLLGCDIESRCEGSSARGQVAADLNQFYPLLKAVNFEADLFVLNPPWDLHWKVPGAECQVSGEKPDTSHPLTSHPDTPHLAPGTSLGTSGLATVREAMKASDPRAGRGRMDSTITTLAMALDLCSVYGEGFLIGNEATLQRLLLKPDAPYHVLACHVWSHLVVEGNICQSPVPGAETVPGAECQVSAHRCQVRSARCQALIPRTPHLTLPNLTHPNLTPRTARTAFKTGIIWFARSHGKGVQLVGQASCLSEAATFCETLKDGRKFHRRGAECKPYGHSVDTAKLWRAAAEEWERVDDRQDACPTKHYHIWQSADGTIRTNLSLFDTFSGRVDQQEAKKLHELNGKHPLQLVVQREQRKALERCVFGPKVPGAECQVSAHRCQVRGAGYQGLTPGTSHLTLPNLTLPNLTPRTSHWRVDPALADAVREALREFASIRAPLYPLPVIQRLGFLDEQDEIECLVNLGKEVPGAECQVAIEECEGSGAMGQVGTVFRLTPGTPHLTPSDPSHLTPRTCFRAGQRYALRSVTVQVRRQTQRMNLEGEWDNVELTGLELAFFLTDGAGVEHAFMEERLRSPDVAVDLIKPGARELGRRLCGYDLTPCPIDFTLHELVEHFHIPDVPDVAQVNPEGYERNLQLLDEIEQLVNV